MEKRMREVEYEFEKLCAVYPISDKLWYDLNIPSIKIANLAHERFVRVIITWEVARRRLAEYRWPATWRDAFKERWFPAWAKERWPVRYEKVALDELAAMRSEDENVRYFI